jgi:hypothetical protein
MGNDIAAHRAAIGLFYWHSVFTEMQLNNKITDDDIAISGFDMPVWKDRNSHGGGIIM